MEKITKNEKQTFNLAKKFAKKLTDGQVVTLSGDLGSGKTVFARGVARGLKINDKITSPTFTIYNYYVGKKELYHFDMYRIESSLEATNIEFEEILMNKAIKLIEWPDIIKEYLPLNTIKVEIIKIDDNKRKIIIQGA